MSMRWLVPEFTGQSAQAEVAEPAAPARYGRRQDQPITGRGVRSGVDRRIPARSCFAEPLQPGAFQAR